MVVNQKPPSFPLKTLEILNPLKYWRLSPTLKAPSVVQSQFSAPSKEEFCINVISLGKSIVLKLLLSKKTPTFSYFEVNRSPFLVF